MITLTKLSNRCADKLKAVRHHYFDNFTFIHINKTGGSSIEKVLNLPLEHRTALEKIEELGRDAWESRYTFSVVRNPWDKVVSHFQFRRDTNQTDLARRPVDFTEWVKLTYGNQDSFYYDQPKMFMPQSDWITDGDGRVLVDFVCRFENLNHDFRLVCRKLGKAIDLPHVKASKRGDYRDYYDEESIEVVTHWFRKDIALFGYRF